jgi:HD superfamily phosphohydrolase
VSAKTFFDALYGESLLNDAIELLIQQPVIQRLRRIRLSNIDSVSMPGVANISRFEHSLGTALLASKVGFGHRISASEEIILQAAALLHDSAIPPYGHLVEEAFQYVSAGVNHEARWSAIFGDPHSQELGGLDLQIFLGREAGLWHWARKTFSQNADKSLNEVLNTIKGEGKFGKCVCGDLDLDNVDNVCRAAWHIGIQSDRSLPIKIAEGMVALDPVKGVIFSTSVRDWISEWLNLRKQVYERFMLSRTDFVGKVMLIYSVIRAYECQEFADADWTLTDDVFIDRLLNSENTEIKNAVASWLSGELWPLSNLVWMNGAAPSYALVYQFSQLVSETLDRPCLAYAIKDKRSRELKIHLDNGTVTQLGLSTKQWLLGVASSLRGDFSGAENRRVVELARHFFAAEVIGKGNEPAESQTLALFE